MLICYKRLMLKHLLLLLLTSIIRCLICGNHADSASEINLIYPLAICRMNYG